MKDVVTGKSLTVYKKDSKHDLAVMAGSTGESNLTYSCNRPVKGVTYHSYGYSSAFAGGDFYNPLPLEVDITATSHMHKNIPGLNNLYAMREYSGPILPGMSGGPVTGNDNVVIALNNAGDEDTTDLFDLADTALCTGRWDK